MTETAEIKKTRKESMLLNVGPAHPAMHGIVRIVTELDGEIVVSTDVEIGYLHRCFEKHSEQGGYLQVIPYTDRLNYVSPLINNVGYCLAVEKLFNLDTPERAKYIRVIMSELSRVSDHLTCVGASAMELGAFTVFLYMIKAREMIYQLIETVTGARLTISYTRVGGVKGDLPEGFEKQCREVIAETRKVIKECDALITKNLIFVDRLKDIGVISKADAISYGITGPFLRSTGSDYDVRRAFPYLVYDRFDFDIPVGEHGDNFDRYLVRMEEMEQSMRIIEQAIAQIPGGPVLVDMEGKEIPADEFRDQGKAGKIEGLPLFQFQISALSGRRRRNFQGHDHFLGGKDIFPEDIFLRPHVKLLDWHRSLLPFGSRNFNFCIKGRKSRGQIGGINHAATAGAQDGVILIPTAGSITGSAAFPEAIRKEPAPEIPATGPLADIAA